MIKLLMLVGAYDNLTFLLPALSLVSIEEGDSFTCGRAVSVKQQWRFKLRVGCINMRLPQMIARKFNIAEQSTYHIVGRKYCITIKFLAIQFYPRLFKNNSEMETRRNYDKWQPSTHWILWCWLITKPE